MLSRRPFLVLCAFLVACEVSEKAPPFPPPLPPKPVAAPIRTDRENYVFQHTPHGLQVTILSTFTAPTDQTVYIVNCNGAMTTGVQRLVGNQWVNAWIVATNGCLSPPIVIPPGGQRTEKIEIRPGPVIYPPDKEQLEPGTYRAAWHNMFTSFDMNAHPFGPELPLEQRVSAPFTIEMPALVPQRPPEITYVEPAEGTSVAGNARILVQFVLSRGAYRLEPNSLRLFVDENDVTDQAMKAGTEDVPMSQMEIVFVPQKGWSPGVHNARVELRDKRGNPASYAWSFSVAGR